MELPTLEPLPSYLDFLDFKIIPPKNTEIIYNHSVFTVQSHEISYNHSVIIQSSLCNHGKSKAIIRTQLYSPVLLEIHTQVCASDYN